MNWGLLVLINSMVILWFNELLYYYVLKRIYFFVEFFLVELVDFCDCFVFCYFRFYEIDILYVSILVYILNKLLSEDDKNNLIEKLLKVLEVMFWYEFNKFLKI